MVLANQDPPLVQVLQRTQGHLEFQIALDFQEFRHHHLVLELQVLLVDRVLQLGPAIQDLLVVLDCPVALVDQDYPESQNFQQVQDFPVDQ